MEKLCNFFDKFCRILFPVVLIGAIANLVVYFIIGCIVIHKLIYALLTVTVV